MSVPYLVNFFVLLLNILSVLSNELLAKDTDPAGASINATVKDHEGHDITPYFKTMLFEEPQKKETSELNDRQVTYVRRIDICGETEGIFIDSSCNHQNKVLGSLQAYTYRCLVYIPHPRHPRYSQRATRVFAGECHDDEICVNGLGQNQLRENNTVDMAHCVKSEAYTRLARSAATTELETSLENLRVDVALSGEDQKTPLQADSITTQSGASSLGGAKGSTQIKNCVDCLDLDTGPLSSNTDYLETEVRLLTTGVAAGILWLTILSG